MRKRLLVAIFVVLLSGLLLAQIALAMSSANYKLDWFTPLTSGGGGAASSTHYAVNLTIGQTARGASTSTSYKAGLGYWYGAVGGYRIYLPLIMK
jgi:biotin transporter BioY